VNARDVMAHTPIVVVLYAAAIVIGLMPVTDVDILRAGPIVAGGGIRRHGRGTSALRKVNVRMVGSAQNDFAVLIRGQTRLNAGKGAIAIGAKPWTGQVGP
jgi:hypothetical protein